MKRLALLAIAVVGVFAVLAAVVPKFVSADLVKHRIAENIAAMTGREVSLKGEPVLSIYPRVAVSVAGMTIAGPNGAKSEPLLTSDTVTAQVRLLPLLFGNAQFDTIEIVKPRIHLIAATDGTPNWHLVPKAAAGDSDESPAAPRHLKLTDGTLVYDDLATARHEEITQVTFDAAWARPTMAINGSGRGEWRGQAVEFNAQLGNPLALATGGASPLRLGLASKPVRVSFNGTVDAGDGYAVEGTATINTPTLRGAIEWLGRPMGTGPTLGAAAIKGKVSWRGSMASFTEAALELDGNSADGAITIDIAGGRPLVQGTLAAAEFDLSPYLEAFRSGFGAGGSWLGAPVSLPLIDAIDADLRISADRLVVGATHIDDAAGSATVTGGRIIVNVAQGRFFGGTLEGQLTLGMTGPQLWSRGEARLAAVPMKPALGELAGTAQLLDAQGAATLQFGGQGETWGDFIQAVSGRAAFGLGEGTFTGVDVQSLAGLAEAPSEPIGMGGGTMKFASMAGTVALTGGALETKDLVIKGGDFSVDVGGLVWLPSGAVAGAATLKLPAAGGGTRQIPIAITGTWGQPSFDLDRSRAAGQAPAAISPAAPRG